MLSLPAEWRKHIMAIFRVFISSTFNDFQCERWVLQQIVFPRLKEKCQQHGAEFLGVDLRWGISPERSSRSKTIQTCFDEIERCQRLSPKPNFVLLLGQRYGYIPIPEIIPNSLYCKIRDFFTKNIESESLLLWDEWYQQDSNDLEKKWLIKPHDECNGYSDPSIQGALKNGLKKATESLDLNLSEEEKCLLTGSATEQEIQKGIFDQAGSSDHVFVWRRVISDLPFSGEDACLYRDSGEGSYNHVSDSRLELLAGKLKSLLGERYLEHNLRLSELSSTVTQAVDEVQLTSYLRNFADTMESQLWAKIEEQIRDEPSQDEESTHRQFARLRSEGIVGREAELAKIHKYLESKPAAPYFIKAPGGMGKTSLLAKAVADVLPQFRERNNLVRFVGASSNISTPTSLLLSLWPNKRIEALAKKHCIDQQECEDFLRVTLLFRESFGLPWPKQLTEAISGIDIEERRQAVVDAAALWRDWLIVEMTAGFSKPREELLLIDINAIKNVQGDSLILLIDALDQLKGYPDLNYLFGKISDSKYEEEYWDQLSIVLSARDVQGNDLHGLSIQDWNNCVENRLNVSNRTLSDIQMSWINRPEECAGNPLVLKLASEFAVRLTANDSPQGSLTLSGCIETLYERIGGSSEHGLLGEKVLQYIDLSRQGIPEDLLLKTLAIDNDVRAWFSATYPHHSWSLENGLPPILWSRIQMDLEAYLIRKDVFGSQALYFFHQEFKDEALAYSQRKQAIDSKLASLNLVKTAWHKLTGEEFFPHESGITLRPFTTKPDGWSIRELPWLLEQAGHQKLSNRLLSDPSFVLAKILFKGGVESLLDDYARSEENEWSKLLVCHYQQLILSQTPDELWIQLSSELPENNTVRISAEKLLKVVSSEQYRLKNLLQQPKPKAQISVGKKANGFVQLDEHQIIVSFNEDHLKILNPLNALSPVKQLKHLSNGRPAYSNQVLVMNCGQYIVASYREEINGTSGAQIVLWQEDKKIAELRSKSSLVDIFPDTSHSFLVVYRDGTIGRWNVKEICKRAAKNYLTSDVSTADSACFTALTEPDHERSSQFGDKRKLIKTGSHHLFVFVCKGLSARIVIVKDNFVREFFSQTNPDNFNYGPLLNPILLNNGHCALTNRIRPNSWSDPECPARDICFEVSPDGEKDLCLPISSGICIEGIWPDSDNGLTLMLTRESLDVNEPRQLIHYDQHLHENWSRNIFPNPRMAGNFLLYKTNAGVHVRCLSTSNEHVFDLPITPTKVSLIDANNLLVLADKEFYRLCLDTGQFHRYVTGKENLSVIKWETSFLTLQPEGILQIWDEESISDSITTDYVTELTDGNVLVCSKNQFLVFQRSSCKLYHKVWKHNDSEPGDSVRFVSHTESGKLWTFGDKYIRIWNTSQATWAIEAQYEGFFVKDLNCNRALQIGYDTFLLEYNGFQGPGFKLAKIGFENGEITFNSIPVNSKATFLTQVNSDGDIVFYTEDDGFAIYNFCTGQTREYSEEDSEWFAWVTDNKPFLESSREKLLKTFDTLTRSIMVVDHPLSEERPFDAKNPIEEAILWPGSCIVFLDNNCAIDADPFLGTHSLKDISIFNEHDVTIASYLDPGNFRLWVNQLDSSGRLYLTDANNNLVVLQLTKGTHVTAVPQ